MRIELNFLLVAFDFPPTVGGIQTRAKNYVRNLVQMGHNVIVVHLLDPEVQRTHFKYVVRRNGHVERYLEATVYRYPSSVKNIFNVFFQTIKTLPHTRLDVIHIVSGANTPIGLLFLIYGKLKRTKTGVSFYGKDILDSHHIFLIFQRIAMVFADKIGVNSKATLRLIPKAFRHKVAILYPGVDVQMLTKLKQARKRRKQERKILFVGRLVKRKGVHELLHAFQLVLKEIPNARLTIVGNGPQRETLAYLAQKLRINDKVEFTGTLVGEELYRKYLECDVFVMPSRKTKTDMEGFGMVFLEAGLLKKPCIGTWSGGIPEAVLHGETGILIPQVDVEALKDTITLLLTNKNLAKKLGENAYNRVISEFTWEKATLSFLKMYQKNQI